MKKVNPRRCEAGCAKPEQMKQSEQLPILDRNSVTVEEAFLDLITPDT